jgi:hypothetical protein
MAEGLDNAIRSLDKIWVDAHGPENSREAMADDARERRWSLLIDLFRVEIDENAALEALQVIAPPLTTSHEFSHLVIGLYQIAKPRWQQRGPGQKLLLSLFVKSAPTAERQSNVHLFRSVNASDPDQAKIRILDGITWWESLSLARSFADDTPTVGDVRPFIGKGLTNKAVARWGPEYIVNPDDLTWNGFAISAD